METGIHSGMSAADYFALRAANKSGLDDLEKSPLHYWAKNLDPDREQRAETPSMRLGTAIHAAVLEPQRFAAEYSRAPQPSDYPGALVSAEDYRARCKALGLPVSGTKEAMKARILESADPVAFFDDIEAAMADRKLLSESEARTVAAIQQRVSSSGAIRAIMGEGSAEQVIVWTDPASGVLCKARADWLTSDRSIIVDLKSAQDASPEGFASSIANYNYHRQAAWYLDGLRAVTGHEALFVFVVCETAPPYACAYYFASPSMIEQGRAENARLLAKYAACLRADQWPGYAEEILALELPAWKRMKETAE